LTLSRGEIVLTRFPFTDLSGSKVRPALIVSPTPVGRDVILAAISSVMRTALSPTDLVISLGHPEFPSTGLRVDSVVRLHKLFTVEQGVIVRRLGRIGPLLQADVDRPLALAVGL
jgi:mRNA interferase MazF